MFAPARSLPASRLRVVRSYHTLSLTKLQKQSNRSTQFYITSNRIGLLWSAQYPEITRRYKSTGNGSPQSVTEYKASLPQRVWKSIKEGAIHYWHGSKLLVSEVRISSRLQTKLLKGGSLTRRERRQVKSQGHLFCQL